MTLIKDNRIADDIWTHHDDAGDLPQGILAEAPLEISYPAWQQAAAQLAHRPGPLALRLAGDSDPAVLEAEDLAKFEMIAIHFPHFTDGRGYSLARHLRERLGFKGELRATGDILKDQLDFLARCGFDSFEITDASALKAWQAAKPEITITYQPTATTPASTREEDAKAPRAA